MTVSTRTPPAALTPAATTRPVRRAAITNLGCKVNQAEMDAVVRLLRARGVEIAEDAAGADLHLVNTCTVTAAADDKSRKAVRRARRASPGATVIVTGCSVQVAAASFAALDPAARLVANEAKDGLLAEVERLLGRPGRGERPEWRRRARRRPARPARGGAADPRRRGGRGDRRRPRPDRPDPRLRQGPGRVQLLLHLLHHPPRPRPRALPRARGGAGRRAARPRAPATARSCSPASTSGPTTAAVRNAGRAAPTSAPP